MFVSSSLVFFVVCCPSVYVGDTQGDADSAAVAGIPFIYASYGFGNVKKYDYSIEKFSDLLDIL